MYELYPYFTNDGTVGLFSPHDDDIYHSMDGALSESWQKFTLPAHLEEYLRTHNSVKILDICYGIGYNTKTALNVFTNHAWENIFQNNFKSKKKLNEFKKNPYITSPSIAAIDTDNIKPKFGEDFVHGHELNEHVNAKNKFCTNLLIDAVDLDKILINISPFIVSKRKFKFLSKNKLNYLPIKNIKISQKMLKKEFRLKKEVSIILLEKLLESNPEFFEDKIMHSILSQKKYSPFFSKFMLNLARFYQNQGYNYNKKVNISAFLHNIYYRYLSKSYKKAKKILKTTKIDLNFYENDARAFIQSTTNKYNFIFLDAFTPAKCPALWTIDFFRELYAKLEEDGMVLTYSNSAAVRNAFLENGFYVGKTYDPDSKKSVGTIAAKNKNLIEYPLDELDLALIKSKAGICFKDENLDLDNLSIVKNRKLEFEQSGLVCSSNIMKGYKNA
ncbi:MAG: MnmC family methyltransferase [Candidatus Gastranaerophilaceae bacterium]